MPTPSKSISKSERPPFSARVRRGELLEENCPSRDILKHVTSRWGVLVMIVLQGGMHRFSDLRRKIGGISEKMLAQTLQELESDGLLDRRSLPVVPPHVEYRLTPLGAEAALHVQLLADWVETSLPRIMRFRQREPKPAARARAA